MIKSILSEKQILIVPLVFVLIVGIMQTVDATSKRGAEEVGYEDGRNDFLNGYEKNPYCDPDNSDPNPDAYCAWYKAGYEAGWLAASLLYGNQ